MPRLTKQQRALVLRYADTRIGVVTAERERYEAWSDLIEGLTPDQVITVERVLSLKERGVPEKSGGGHEG